MKRWMILLIVVLSLLLSFLLMRTSELFIFSRVTDGEKTEYRKDGVLAYAANPDSAETVSSENSEDSEKGEIQTFFDADGNPVKQSDGHYALKKTYIQGDNRSIVFQYLDINLQPMINTSGYSTLIRELKDGVVATDWYKDLDGNPVANKLGAYGRKLGYENGRVTAITYVDADGTPKRIRPGYATVKRSFYEEGPWIGKIENEFYFDEHDRPTALSLGQYGVHKEYDALGRNDVLTYLGMDGHPMVTKAGYTTVKNTFYPDGTVKTEMYFGLDGAPVALSQGQYGILKENGRTAFLDAKGEVMFSFRNFLYLHPVIVLLFALALAAVITFLGEKVNACVLIAYAVFVIYMTLIYRSEGESGTNLEIFWSYKQFFSSQSLRLQILNNIWLFVPLGAVLFKLWPKAWFLLVPIVLSVLIEMIQYLTGLGYCELDDVISNSLGGVLGFGFAYFLDSAAMRLRKRIRRKAMPKK